MPRAKKNQSKKAEKRHKKRLLKVRQPKGRKEGQTNKPADLKSDEWGGKKKDQQHIMKKSRNTSKTENDREDVVHARRHSSRNRGARIE